MEFLCLFLRCHFIGIPLVAWWNVGCFLMLDIRQLNQRWRQWQWQRERQQNSSFRLAKQQLCMCITHFCILCCPSMTTTWKCLISCFMEDVNTRQQFPFSSSELQYSPLEFNSRKIHHYLLNWTRWNKWGKVFEAERINLWSDVFVAIAVIAA